MFCLVYGLISVLSYLTARFLFHSFGEKWTIKRRWVTIILSILPSNIVVFITCVLALLFEKGLDLYCWFLDSYPHFIKKVKTYLDKEVVW